MIICTGVPQGSVLSPALFNFFVSDFPGNADCLSAYADDITASESDYNVPVLDDKLQAKVSPIIEKADQKKLSIDPTKSQVTLFTPWTKQFNTRPNISINGEDVPLCRTPKILGVTIDTMFRFSHHVAAIAAKALQLLKLLKAASGFSWGHDKETLGITYRVLIKSVFNFAGPVYFPSCKASNTATLQRIQSAALRPITGCHLATSVTHLHTETKLMPVAEHLSLLCSQFLAKCLSPSHPSHDIVLQSPGPRKNNQGLPMKETLSSKFQEAVAPYLQDGIIPASIFNRTKDAIRT
jgi:hypothetical protein